MTISINAGNLWTHSYLDKVIQLNKKYQDVQVKSLFGSIAHLTPTARSFDRIPDRPGDFIEAYVKKAKENGINIRYTLNQSCIGSIQDFRDYFDNSLKAILYWLRSIGVDEWTVASPLLIELLGNMFPDDFIEVSTIAEVSTVQDAVRWSDLGANAVNVSTSINRDFKRLLSIGKELQVSILCNEACLFRCAWRRECYNLSSHDSRRSEGLFGYYPFSRCNEVRLEHPEEWLRSRLVVPQWIPEYENRSTVTNFKVAYRTHPEEVAIPLLEAYMRLYFTGNLCALWPTISKLGNTPEPKDVTNIPCDKLDELMFINHWFDGDLCSNQVCDVSCFHCSNIYGKCKA